jgi:rare lipoprotein A
MHKLLIYLSLFLCASNIFAQTAHVYHAKATYYSKKFDGRKTYSGERFHSNKYTAAHRSFPIQSLVKVTNPLNNKSVIVRINDRFRRKNFIDISLIAAKQIDIVRQGIAKVSIQLLDSSFLQQYINQSISNITMEPIPDVAAESNTIDTLQKYYIRLASFKLKKNAKLLLSKKALTEYKDIAHIQKTSYKGKQIYKIMIGPFLSKEEAVTHLKKIKTKYTDAIIQNFLHSNWEYLIKCVN